MIEDYIFSGPENAISTRTLAKVTGSTVRGVLAAVQARRRQGVPILSSKDADGGLFLAEDAGQILAYCRRLEREEQQIRETRQAIEKVISKWSGKALKAL